MLTRDFHQAAVVVLSCSSKFIRELLSDKEAINPQESYLEGCPWSTKCYMMVYSLGTDRPNDKVNHVICWHLKPLPIFYR